MDICGSSDGRLFDFELEDDDDLEEKHAVSILYLFRASGKVLSFGGETSSMVQGVNTNHAFLTCSKEVPFPHRSARRVAVSLLKGRVVKTCNAVTRPEESCEPYSKPPRVSVGQNCGHPPLPENRVDAFDPYFRLWTLYIG